MTKNDDAFIPGELQDQLGASLRHLLIARWRCEIIAIETYCPPQQYGVGLIRGHDIDHLKDCISLVVSSEEQ